MKVVLTCKHCFADHEISESKVAGKHGKFRCIRCKALTPFSFVSPQTETSAEIQEGDHHSNLILFDLNFDKQIPSTPLRGQFHGSFFQKIDVYWFESKILFLTPEEKNLISPKQFVSITGNFDPKKFKGLQFDIRPTDPINPLREIFVSDHFKTNVGYRFSLVVDESDSKFVNGKLYFAIPDDQNTYFYGSFIAHKIFSVKFSSDVTSDFFLPDFLSNFLTSKVLLLSGNIIYVQDSFNRLDAIEKEKLFILLVDVWKSDEQESPYILRFFEENVEFEIATSEKKLNEAIVFLIANQVNVGDFFWSVLKRKIKKSPTKDESYFQILKKRYPKEFEQLLEELANRMVIPKDPSSIIARDDAESLKALLESGFSPNFIKENEDTNPLHFSLLHEAALSESSKCAITLLEYGADPNYLDKIGENAIFKICQNNIMHLQEKITLLDALIQNGIDLNHRSENQMTALHWCAMFGEPSLAKKLIIAGINIEQTDLSLNTALHEACKFGHSSVLALLLEAGANANSANDEHKTGRDLAFEALEIAQLEGDIENQGRMERILSLLDVYGG